MKQFKLLSILALGAVPVLLSSCNQDREFPDYQGGTAVYFANQYPVRTIVLGEDFYDTTADNEHRFAIYATMGGVYSNTKRVEIGVQVDNTLTDNLYYDMGGTNPVVAMPSNYYSLAGDQIVLDKKFQGAVGIQLTDAFFADPKALETTYVVPLVMTDVQNADSILSGARKADPAFAGASRTNANGWDVAPKDYVLYAVKFINPWDAVYLRRGVDQITTATGTETVVRHESIVESDQVISLTSASLTTAVLPLSASDAEGTTIPFELLLTFSGGLDGDDATVAVASNTEGVTASGTGTWVIDGEKKAWGNTDRNALYLDYSVNLSDQQYATRDTLVFRDRGIKPEVFEPTYIVE